VETLQTDARWDSRPRLSHIADDRRLSGRFLQWVLDVTRVGNPKNNFFNCYLRFLTFICYKQFTESSGVASRSYCLHLSGLSGI